MIRELAFIVESNNYRWARLMKALLQQACHLVNASSSKALSAAACKALRKRYRTILTQGRKELPALPPRKQGQRGPLAKSDAHNLHERLAQHEESVLRFLHDADVPFTKHVPRHMFRIMCPPGICALGRVSDCCLGIRASGRTHISHAGSGRTGVATRFR